MAGADDTRTGLSRRARVWALAVGAGLVGGSASAPGMPEQRAALVPTFSHDVAPLVYAKCGPCHHPRGAGPFSLLEYDDVLDHVKEIRKVTRSRFMPPWRPAPGVAAYLNDRSLTPAEIDLLMRWIDGGAPLGDAREVPAAPTWPDGWQLGEPDLVVQMPEAYELPADGPDVYRNFVIPAPLVEHARFVNGWELRTGTRAVHHAILNIDRLGVARARDAKDPGLGFSSLDPGGAQSPDGFFLVWTPGKVPAPRTQETAWRIDDHTDLVLQLHLQPTGKPEHVRPSVALYFSDRPPTVPQFVLRVGDMPIDVAPGDAHYVAHAAYTLPTYVAVRSVFPHAHYLARTMHVWATLPASEVKELLRIDDWDFAWQDQYVLAQPVMLPAGSRIEMEYVYDNSEANPRNPSQPPRRVRTGEQSTDEMGNVTFEVVPLARGGMGLLRESKYRSLLEAGDSARNEYNLANALADLGKREEAESRYKRAIVLDPQLAMARYNLSLLLTAEGDADGAMAQLRQAIAVKPDYVDARVNLGAALEKKGRLAEAIAQYRAAIASDPRSALAHDALALALAHQGNRPEAIEQFRAGLALEPENALAQRYLNELLADAGP
ncbi:MAG TPA: tetratricopeptide repeat protein [Polyangiaceae bacterium]